MLKMYARLSGTINGETLLDYRATGMGLSFGGYCFQMECRRTDHSGI